MKNFCFSRGLSLLISTLLMLISSLALAEFDKPRGIYLLGHTDRVSVLSEAPFISGFSHRVSWPAIEPEAGQYDFSTIIAMLNATAERGLGLNLEIIASNPPDYVNQAASILYEGGTLKRLSTRPVPWDEGMLLSFERLLIALAATPVMLPDGSVGVLSEHPTLKMVSASIPGLGGLRDRSGNLVELAEYERQRFIDAVLRSVRASREPFSKQFGFVPFFLMNDGENPDLSLDEELRVRLMQEFNNLGQPSLGFFQELLSDVGPNPEQMGKHLKAVSDRTYIVFQALTAWSRPFTGADKVTSGSPATGLTLGFEEYGATFFELYRPDIDNPELAAELTEWSQRLQADEVEVSTPSSALTASSFSISVNEQWREATSDTADGNTVMFYSAPSSNGVQRGVVRMRNDVPIPSFRFQEWSNLDGLHIEEQLDVVQLNKGRWQYGQHAVEVGSAELEGTEQWITINFAEAFTEPPQVILALQTTHGGDAVSARVQKITTTSMEIQLVEEDKKKFSGHVTETIAYLLVFSPDNSFVAENDIPFQLHSNAQNIKLNHNWKTVASGYQLRLEEDQTQDDETDHIDELIHLLSINGVILSQIVSDRGADNAVLRARVID